MCIFLACNFYFISNAEGMTKRTDLCKGSSSFIAHQFLDIIFRSLSLSLQKKL